MKTRQIIITSLFALLPLFAGTAAAEATLWGIYGAHSKHDCPVNNRGTAKEVITISKTDLTPLMEKYGVTEIVDMYHSGLEHTLVWVVETSRPHDLEEFTIELGVARYLCREAAYN